MSDSKQTAQDSLSDAPVPYIDANAPIEIAQTMTTEAERAGEAIGQSVEQSLDKAQVSFDRVQESAEEAQSGLKASAAAASSGVSDFNMMAFDVMKVSTDAALDYFAALAKAKTLPDVIAIQTEFMGKQFEAMSAQTREFAKLAEEVSARSFAPINKTFSKTFGTAA
ncbi:MAG: phasin family protein [Beijerinckiaceae bacterium]|nr:phasin family protein [Beijerinckiaceae bacterium]